MNFTLTPQEYVYRLINQYLEASTAVRIPIVLRMVYDYTESSVSAAIKCAIS
jgi:hypothetical protein